MDFEEMQRALIEGETEVARLRKNVQHLLRQVGDEGQCRGCGATIYWVKHKSGKKAPYTVEGLNHFADCPKAQSFR